MLLSLGSRPMKIFDKTPFSFTTFLLIFFLASCGDDHAGDNHSDSGHDSDSHAPKSQENLLTMLEETDSPHGETSVHAPIANKHETAESANHGASSSANDLEALLGGAPPVLVSLLTEQKVAITGNILSQKSHSHSRNQR